jgi:hypothetical protein
VPRIGTRPAALIEINESTAAVETMWLPRTARARRYSPDARASDVARSAAALARLGAFYAVGREAAEVIARRGLTGDAADAARLRRRRGQAVPKLAEFARWLEARVPAVLPNARSAGRSPTPGGTGRRFGGSPSTAS